MSQDQDEDLDDRSSTTGRAKRRGERSTAPLPRKDDHAEGDGAERARGEGGAGRRGQEQRASAHRAGRLRPRLRTWLAFAGGLLAGLVLLPVALAILLSLADGDERLRPTPAPPGQPDLVVDMSRAYLERTAAISANKREGLLKVHEPTVELGQHPAGGASMVVRAQVQLPLIGTHGLVAMLHLAPVNGELAVATEQIALGEGGKITVPGRLIEGWLDDMVNDAVQDRLQANSRYRIEVVDVSAGADNLIVKAFLRER